MKHCCEQTATHFPTHTDAILRRFLRARKFDITQSKKMIKDCQEWRRTVEGVGIDELYRRIDPFDVSARYFLAADLNPNGEPVS